MKSKILKKNNTHIARREKDGRIWVSTRAFTVDGTHYPEERLWPVAHEDDLFAVFEELEEESRILFNQFLEEMS